jgi:opacity protein-like surface antigen
MAKNCLAALVFTVVVSGGIYAQTPFRLSAGLGGFTGGDFGGGVDVSANIPGSVIGVPGTVSVDMSHETPYFGGGAFIFLDATYAELSFGFFGGSGESKSTINMNLGGFFAVPPETINTDMTYLGLTVGLLLKYPVAIGDKLSVFPLFGIDYQIMLSVKDKDGNEGVSGVPDRLSGLIGAVIPDDETINSVINNIFDSKSGDYSAFWFKLGAGADYSFTDKVYLRLEALYGIRLLNDFEKNMDDMLGPYKILGVKTDERLGHGFSAKAAVGYRF